MLSGRGWGLRGIDYRIGLYHLFYAARSRQCSLNNQAPLLLAARDDDEVHHRLRCHLRECSGACCECVVWPPLFPLVPVPLFRNTNFPLSLCRLLLHTNSKHIRRRCCPPGCSAAISLADTLCSCCMRLLLQGFHRITTRLGGTANLNTTSSSQQSFLWTHEGLSRGNPVVQVGRVKGFYLMAECGQAVASLDSSCVQTSARK